MPDGDVIHYVHDAMGRRTGKVLNGQLVEGWLYADGLRPIAQLNAAGQIEATYVYGSRSNVPDLIVENNGSSPVTYRVVADHLGTPRLVVRVSDGVVVHRLDVDEFGRVMNESGVRQDLHPFGFAAGLRDRDTGLVRFGVRDYDPVTGRWTATDPVLFGGGTANLYEYVGGDPLNRVDPSGKFWFVIGGVAVVALGGLYVYDAWADVQGLRGEAVNRYPGDRERANAWQHCTGACRLAVQRGVIPTYALGYGREYTLNLFDDSNDRRNDLANNACGIAHSELVGLGLGAQCRELCADGPAFTSRNMNDNSYAGAP